MSGPSKSHERLSIGATFRARELLSDVPTIAGAWAARVITLFPECFPGVLGSSLTGRALAAGLWQLNTINLRQFGDGKHKNVDDTPAGGGPGMVLRSDVMAKAIDAAQSGTRNQPILYLTPRGKPLTQARVAELARGGGATIICGRFEGLDERVITNYGIEEVSLGDFVMTGGEIAAMALIDATVRLLPNVLGNATSTQEESFSAGLLEHPQYTRPTTWRGQTIPPVLVSGDHGKVADWRQAEAEKTTRERRPDLWQEYLSQKEDEK